MILTPIELPSQGLDNGSETISIRGLGLQEMIEYTKSYESADNVLKKYLVDFEWTKKIIPNWRTINLVDLDAVILRWKKESVSDTNEFTVKKKCPRCGSEQTLELQLSQLTNYIPIEYSLTTKVVLNNKEYTFQCPNLEVFDKVCSKLTRSGRVRSIELFKLIASFPDFESRPNQIEDLIINARLIDIQVLKTLESIYYRSNITIRTTCNNCKEADWSMGVSSLIDNPFLSLVLSSESIEDKISFRKVCRVE